MWIRSSYFFKQAHHVQLPFLIKIKPSNRTNVTIIIYLNYVE